MQIRVPTVRVNTARLRIGKTTAGLQLQLDLRQVLRVQGCRSSRRGLRARHLSQGPEEGGQNRDAATEGVSRHNRLAPFGFGGLRGLRVDLLCKVAAVGYLLHLHPLLCVDPGDRLWNCWHRQHKPLGGTHRGRWISIDGVLHHGSVADVCTPGLDAGAARGSTSDSRLYR